MRIDPREVRSQSVTSKKGWGSATDAPTYLPSDELVLPLRAPKSDSVVTSAPKQKKVAPAPNAGATPAAAPAIQPRGASQSTIKPARGSAPVVAAPAPAAAAAPVAAPVAAPAAPAPAAQAAAAIAAPVGELVPPFVAFEGGASFDPLALPLPPELAAPIYGWLRRVALQADLGGADRLLRDALCDLTSALNVLIIYASPEGLHSLGANDELPKDMEAVIAVARSRRALVGTHSALVPIATTNETIAVIKIDRNPRQPAFNMVDHVTMAGVARECASIMHHLVVEHLQRRGEAEADKKSLYRHEALESHRRRGQEGTLTELTPGWVRATYRILIAALIVAVAFAIFIHVPTYSSGHGTVVYKGTPITSPAPGTVEAIYVSSGMQVPKGALLLKLKADKEEADLEQAKREYVAAQQQYLIDPADENNRKQMNSAQNTVARAQAAIDAKKVRATRDGKVSDLRAREGGALQFGDQILSIVAPGTEPEVWAYLPGSDRPRLKLGQPLQVDLTGYQKTREVATIYHVDGSATGANELRKSLGPELADSLKIADGSYVLVKAKLKRNYFRAKGKQYPFFQGMPAKTEVKVESKRFIVTLLPSLEKYVP